MQLECALCALLHLRSKILSHGQSVSWKHLKHPLGDHMKYLQGVKLSITITIVENAFYKTLFIMFEYLHPLRDIVL